MVKFTKQGLCTGIKVFLTLFLLAFLAGQASAQVKELTITKLDGNNLTHKLDGTSALEWVEILKSNDPDIIAKTFRRDANNTDDDQWTGGSQDQDLVSDWYWVNGGTNDKGDISNAGVVMIGKTIFFFGDRTAINGDAQIGFWFFLGGITQNNIKGKGGFRFSGTNVQGDVLGISNFINGGGTPQLLVYERQANMTLALDGAKTWLAVNSGTIPAPNTTGLSSAVWPFSHKDPITGATIRDDWTFKPKSGDDQTYPAPLFFEGSIDFASVADAKLCFTNFLLETRNSQSINASLQDFVAGEFNVTPLPPKVTPDAECVGKDIELGASCSSGGSTPRWYETKTSTTVLAEGNTLTLKGLAPGEYTRFASCYNPVTKCESERVEVKATVYKLPSIVASITSKTGVTKGTGTTECPKLWNMNIALATTADLTATGGVTYSWSVSPVDAATSFTFDANTGAATFTVKTPVGLAPEYKFTVTGTDANGCVNTDIVCIRPSGSCPTCQIDGATQSCANTKGIEYKNTLGADADFIYTWSIEGSNATIASTAPDNQSIKVDVTSAGAYKVVLSVKSKSGLLVCDGCSLKAEVREVSCTAEKISDVVCNGESNGSAKVTPANGYAPYTVLWDNGETTETATKLNAGKHTVTVTDAKGCKTTCDVTIGEPPLLTCTVALINGTECTANTGSAKVTAVGGNGGYTYLWDNGETTQTATKLSKGEHTVTVTDAKGCKTTCKVTIPELPCAHIFPTQTTCCNYLGPNTTTFQLLQVCTTLGAGNKVTNAIPGVFFYYGDFTPTTSGQVTIYIKQITGGYQPFAVQNENQVRVYVDDCQSVTFTSTISGGNATASFQAIAGRKYVISVKYDTKSIIGFKIPSGTAYQFGMSLDNVNMLSGSVGQLKIVAGCSDNTPAPTGDGCNTTLTRAASDPVSESLSNLSVSAVPNPYNDKVRFTIESSVSGQGTLEVFNMLGQKVKTVYEGHLQAGRPHQVEFSVPPINRENLIYILRIGKEHVTGKLINRR